MALQTTTNINVDFYDKKYILINAKQFDKKSRFISVACYNRGKIYPLNEGEHSAYIRYKKSDNNSVFNFCEIDRKGNIIVELTEQMLAINGICRADLVIVNEGGAKVNTQTGEIIGIENGSILSTMPIHIDVVETAIDNSDIESSYEFNGLNAAIEKAEAEYEDVIKASRSWAVGNTGIREGENTDNAKYYYEQARKVATGAAVIGVKGNNETNYRTGNVNLTADNIGAVSLANAVIGVKGNKETDYRTGNINLTADNIGAVSLADIATVDEVKDYLGII